MQVLGIFFFSVTQGLPEIKSKDNCIFRTNNRFFWLIVSIEGSGGQKFTISFEWGNWIYEGKNLQKMLAACKK